MQLKPSDAVPELIPQIAEWLFTEWGRHLPNRSVATAEAALRQNANSEGLPATVIAVEEGKPVGVARLVESDLQSRPDLNPWLASVYVPEYKRNQGIGSILCSEVVNIAKQLGFARLYLFTPDRSAFYERQGWSVVGHERHCDMEVTLMKIELDKQDNGSNSAAPLATA